MSTPPGWYPDPEWMGRERYWDGQTWTPESRPYKSRRRATPPRPGHPSHRRPDPPRSSLRSTPGQPRRPPRRLPGPTAAVRAAVSSHTCGTTGPRGAHRRRTPGPPPTFQPAATTIPRLGHRPRRSVRRGTTGPAFPPAPPPRVPAPWTPPETHLPPDVPPLSSPQAATSWPAPVADGGSASPSAAVPAPGRSAPERGGTVQVPAAGVGRGLPPGRGSAAGRHLPPGRQASGRAAGVPVLGVVGVEAVVVAAVAFGLQLVVPVWGAVAVVAVWGLCCWRRSGRACLRVSGGGSAERVQLEQAWRDVQRRAGSALIGWWSSSRTN